MNNTPHFNICQQIVTTLILNLPKNINNTPHIIICQQIYVTSLNLKFVNKY